MKRAELTGARDIDWKDLAEGPMHHIRIDRETLTLDVRFSGEPTPIDVGWMAECVRHAVRSFGEDAGSHRALYDCTGVEGISAATIDHIRASLPPGSPRPLAACKTAFVIKPSERAQVARLASILPGMRLFEGRDAALAWLNSEEREEA